MTLERLIFEALRRCLAPGRELPGRQSTIRGEHASLHAVGDDYARRAQSVQAQTCFQRAISVDENDEGT
jgi:hypothetical protein